MSIRTLIALYRMKHPAIISWIDGQNVYIEYGPWTLFKTDKDIYLLENGVILEKRTPLIMPKI